MVCRTKTLRVKFPKEVKNILNEKRISNKKIVEMQKFIEESKEYKNLTKVGEEYQPYLRNINRESFDYQGINSVDELKLWVNSTSSIFPIFELDMR
jgi:hypothetical protein